MVKQVTYSKKVDPKTGLPLLQEESKLQFEPKHGLAYWLFAKPVAWLSKIVLPVRVSGRENIPKKSGLVITFNHISNLDAVAISATAPRRLYFLGKIELSRGLRGRLFNSAGIIPVDRARYNSEALNTAVQVLKRGGVVGIAPEGRTNRSGQLAPFKFGAVAMASRAKVPIVPAIIIGRYIPFMRKISVVYGQPLMVDESDLKSANEKLWYTMNSMREKLREECK
ncbi:1-acyl-sn-glycerol-3-phosphate acyltransferase [Candidatus Saccharibacteria bacterium]|nr:1-acyl-sn-glycerol-3-phosphate acyltransferase [Candidatus Saccharibacteria bacterium]